MLQKLKQALKKLQDEIIIQHPEKLTMDDVHLAYQMGYHAELDGSGTITKFVRKEGTK